ncbi:MAG: hypothetical protein K0R61_2673, partial [Microvirga sp.]|nr:hypothetical protein [Microvirga sp.]
FLRAIPSVPESNRQPMNHANEPMGIAFSNTLLVYLIENHDLRDECPFVSHMP